MRKDESALNFFLFDNEESLRETEGCSQKSSAKQIVIELENLYSITADIDFCFRKVGRRTEFFVRFFLS